MPKYTRINAFTHPPQNVYRRANHQPAAKYILKHAYIFISGVGRQRTTEIQLLQVRHLLERRRECFRTLQPEIVACVHTRGRVTMGDAMW